MADKPLIDLVGRGRTRQARIERLRKRLDVVSDIVDPTLLGVIKGILDLLEDEL